MQKCPSFETQYSCQAHRARVLGRQIKSIVLSISNDICSTVGTTMLLSCRWAGIALNPITSLSSRIAWFTAGGFTDGSKQPNAVFRSNSFSYKRPRINVTSNSNHINNLAHFSANQNGQPYARGSLPGQGAHFLAATPIHQTPLQPHVTKAVSKFQFLTRRFACHNPQLHISGLNERKV